MEVIANGKNGLRRGCRRHVHGLQALVVAESTGNPGKCAAIAADEAGKCLANNPSLFERTQVEADVI